MSWDVTAWAAKQTAGSSSGKLVLLCAADKADSLGSLWWPQKKLVEETELGEDTLRARLADLEALGLIARFKMTRDDGSFTNDLIILLHDQAACDYAEWVREQCVPLERGGATYPTIAKSIAVGFERPDRKGSIPKSPARKNRVSHPDTGRGPIPTLVGNMNHTEPLLNPSARSNSNSASGEAEGQQALSEADEALRSRCLEVCRTDKTERTFVDFGTDAFKAWTACYVRLGLTGPSFTKRIVFDAETKTAEQRTGSYFPNAWPPDAAECAA